MKKRKEKKIIFITDVIYVHKGAAIFFYIMFLYLKAPDHVISKLSHIYFLGFRPQSLAIPVINLKKLIFQIQSGDC